MWQLEFSLGVGLSRRGGASSVVPRDVQGRHGCSIKGAPLDLEVLVVLEVHRDLVPHLIPSYLGLLSPLGHQGILHDPFHLLDHSYQVSQSQVPQDSQDFLGAQAHLLDQGDLVILEVHQDQAFLSQLVLADLVDQSTLTWWTNNALYSWLTASSRGSSYSWKPRFPIQRQASRTRQARLPRLSAWTRLTTRANFSIESRNPLWSKLSWETWKPRLTNSRKPRRSLRAWLSRFQWWQVIKSQSRLWQRVKAHVESKHVSPFKIQHSEEWKEVH
ncbi:unnamed protein product [Menidia menidia]|uniref:(Atlantic silverside) hypothetical protein n=1 Tax=Menidia menidia TaxID=238744 RepID=A0A8S4AU64_9TELE|nr:unnamed protein product [Menidia menidia]